MDKTKLLRGEHGGGFPLMHVAELSITHIPENVARELNAGGTDAVVHQTEYGWLVWTGSEENWDTEALGEPIYAHSLPAELYRVLSLARKHGCRYVLFDQDAPVFEGLPTWEW